MTKFTPLQKRMVEMFIGGMSMHDVAYVFKLQFYDVERAIRAALTHIGGKT